MTDNNNNLQNILVESFSTFESTLDNQSPEALQQLRKKAIQQFAQLGFPTTKNEEWKYTNLNILQKQSFQFFKDSSVQTEHIKPFLLDESEAHRLVFINGRFRRDLSILQSLESGIVIQSLREAVEKNADIVTQYFGKLTNIEKESFSALNTAYADEGVFIFVPKGKIVSKPVILYFISDVKEATIASQARNLVIVSENSQLTLIEKYDSIGENASFNNILTEIFVHQQAVVEHTQLQNENEQAIQINTTQVLQDSKSVYSHYAISMNGAVVRNNLNLSLDGEFIEANMYGLYMIGGKTLVDNHSSVDHLKPNSISNEYYKGIIQDSATGVFNGKIFVRPDAQKTNAYQQNRNVLISDTASVNTKPQLEIWADDVKCSHGATTGNLDATALFYLRSRGIPEKEAKSLLIEAFGNEIVEKIKLTSIQNYLKNLIQDRLS